MTTKTKKLFNEAMKLSYRERAVLAEQLWNSADEKEWLDELHRRADEMRSGKVKAIPIDKPSNNWESAAMQLPANVEVHPEAFAEADDAYEWYANADPNVADRFRGEVRAAAMRISE